ncbi:Zinc finger, CHC2-type [Cinara cedri]|uniref:Zinc finger, CHC2-type n=1 Tax=Cinara cedri TaxID=506608 RepID=A0A5E4NR75_9HEMI|nr:Zinc finger, CHC2-type [Cinara cedri]
MFQTLNCKELKEELLNNLRSCLEYLFPNGTFHSHEFWVGNIQGNRGKSLRVELTGDRKGLWKDFATNEKGDIIYLWAAVKGKNARTEFIEVMASIGEWLGKKHTSVEYLEKYLTYSWNYYDANNQVIVIVSRFDPPGRKKEYRPFNVKTLSYEAPVIRRCLEKK